nr:hypothetical protein [Tanacetum cinerariifolium]
MRLTRVSHVEMILILVMIVHDMIGYCKNHKKRAKNRAITDTRMERELAEYINTPRWNRPTFYNNGEDDDEDYTFAITPNFLITDSLSMGDEHLSTILETKSNELIKSSVENLVPNPSESKDLSDIENSLIISSLKFDSLLEEFSGKLAHIDLIPWGITEADFDPEEEIRLVGKLVYDNSSLRPSVEFNSKNSDTVIEPFSLSPIHVKGSDSLMKEIDICLAPDDSVPLGIKNDDYDSEGDILFLE